MTNGFRGLRFLCCTALIALSVSADVHASDELSPAELRELVEHVLDVVLSETNLVTDTVTPPVTNVVVLPLTNAVPPVLTNAVPPALTNAIPHVLTNAVLPAMTNDVVIPLSNTVSTAETNRIDDLPSVPVPATPRSWYGPRLTVGVTTVDTDEDFDFAEISAGIGVPWPEFLSFMAYGDLELVGGLAYMRDENDDEAALLIFGPAVTFSLFNDRVTIDIGSRPTLISESELGSHPLGGPIQFISHGAVRVQLSKHIQIGGRIQHMSSAGFDDPNPGADILAVDFVYRP